MRAAIDKCGVLRLAGMGRSSPHNMTTSFLQRTSVELAYQRRLGPVPILTDNPRLSKTPSTAGAILSRKWCASQSPKKTSAVLPKAPRSPLVYQTVLGRRVFDSQAVSPPYSARQASSLLETISTARSWEPVKRAPYGVLGSTPGFPRPHALKQHVHDERNPAKAQVLAVLLGEGQMRRGHYEGGGRRGETGWR